ncbi:unnamed protein product, partial [marine sediment metagenome]
MNEEEKKQLDEAMKKIYGSNKSVNKKKVEEELANIGKEVEGTKEEVTEVKEEMEKVGKTIQEIRGEAKSPPMEKAINASHLISPPTTAKEAVKGECFTVSVNPHVKDKVTISKIMWSVVIALLPAVIAGVYFFKLRALLIILVSIITAVATEFIIFKLAKKEIPKLDGSAVITGLLLGLILPPTVPLWLPILGVVFAIGIGKQIFGGLGHNIFNPALVGRVFLVASFPVLMTRWILPDGIT